MPPPKTTKKRKIKRLWPPAKYKRSQVDHNKIIRPKNAAGATKNPHTLTFWGNKNSFVRSLTPSISGCKTPPKRTLLGPIRLWVKPRIFRSKRVKKATERRAPRITTTVDNKKKIIASLRNKITNLKIESFKCTNTADPKPSFAPAAKRVSKTPSPLKAPSPVPSQGIFLLFL